MKKLLVTNPLIISFTAFLIFLNIACFPQDTLVKSELPVVQKILGLTFTEAERDSMYDEVKFTVKEFDKMRKMPLPNSVPLTLAFNPVLPGMTFNHTQQKIKDRKSVV